MSAFISESSECSECAQDVDAGEHIEETTYEVDYRAIVFGKQCPWFTETVAALVKSGHEMPSESHGFSRALTNVHRAHPALSYACAPCHLLPWYR